MTLQATRLARRRFLQTAAADCGRVLNPVGARQQVEGSVLFGLSDALFGEITIREGAVQQANFNDCCTLRLSETPEIDVHFVDSGARITGLGEPATPPIAPAVANAVFRRRACGCTACLLRGRGYPATTPFDHPPGISVGHNEKRCVVLPLTIGDRIGAALAFRP